MIVAFTQSRLTALEDRINESENALAKFMAERGGGAAPKSSIVLKSNPPT